MSVTANQLFFCSLNSKLISPSYYSTEIMSWQVLIKESTLNSSKSCTYAKSMVVNNEIRGGEKWYEIHETTEMCGSLNVCPFAKHIEMVKQVLVKPL